MADKDPPVSDPPVSETASTEDTEAPQAEATEDRAAPTVRSMPQGYSQQYHYNSYGHDP